MVDVLAFGAHPDDVEFGCGGILAKMAAEGKKIAIADLTLGDKSTHGTVEIRRKEALKAAEVIGADRVFLDFKDCEVYDNYESRLKLVQVIRTFKPRLVLAPLYDGASNHPDHIACGQLARYACRLARFKNILPELPAHHVGGILHYLYPIHGVADFYVDVSDHVETWKKLVLSHETQMKTLPYMDWLLRVADGTAVFAETGHVQGLKKGNPIIIDDIMDLSHQIREL